MTGLKGNEAIIKLAKTVGGNAWEFLSEGARASAKAYKSIDDGGTLKDVATSIGKGHMKEGAELALENIDAKKIAGSYMLASGGYRAMSGGGAYKDKHGNTNVIGVPFV